MRAPEADVRRGGDISEDLTAGLVGQPVDGILGYAPETATAVMRNVVLAAAANQ